MDFTYRFSGCSIDQVSEFRSLSSQAKLEVFSFPSSVACRKKKIHFICLSPNHEYSVIQISSFGALVVHV